MFVAGKKTYYIHRIIYECHNGLIKDGLVIDHIDFNPQINSLDNLQVVTQSENNKLGKTGKHAKKAKSVKSFEILSSKITRKSIKFKNQFLIGKNFE